MARAIQSKEAAKYLGIHCKTLMKYDYQGKLTPLGRTATGRRVYSKAQLDQFCRHPPKRRRRPELEDFDGLGLA